MANLTPTPGWDNVFQLETDTPVLGGAGGVANSQAQALLNRFGFLEGDTGSSKLGHTPAGTGAVPRKVNLKLDELVSVKDFGAVGDGVADDTAAIQAAVNAHKLISVPDGDYKITSSIAVPSGRRIFGTGRTARISAYGVDAFTIAAAQDAVEIESLSMLSYTAGGAADPRLYVAILSNGTSGNQVNNGVFRDLYLQGWADAINLRYTWTTRVQNVSTINCNNGVLYFGQCVNNTISDSSLICNAGEASVRLVNDGSTIGEGLMISNTLLSSGDYGIQSGTGFLSLHVSNCIIDLIQDIGLKITDVRSLHCAGNWIFAANKGIEYAALGANIDVNGAITSNTIEVTSSTGVAVDIGSANRGVNVIGGAIKISGTATGVLVNGENCFTGGVHFVNSGTGRSVNLNVTTGNKIGACTGTVTTQGGFQNDYSTGTWTPNISADGLEVSFFVATSALGSYTKIGRQVTLICEYAYSSIGAVGGSFGIMRGIPFNRANDSIEPVVFCAINQNAFDTRTYQANFASVDQILFQYNNGEGTLYGGVPYMTGTDFPASGTIRFVMTYFAAS